MATGRGIAGGLVAGKLGITKRCTAYVLFDRLVEYEDGLSAVDVHILCVNGVWPGLGSVEESVVLEGRCGGDIVLLHMVWRE